MVRSWLAPLRPAWRRLKEARHLPYRSRMRWETWQRNRRAVAARRTGRHLLAVAAGQGGVPWVTGQVQRFGPEFDIILFIFDDAAYDDPIFDRCRKIRERGVKWGFMQKYLAPDQVQAYDYLFLWDDDIDVMSFSPQRYLDVVRRNHLEVSQPSLVHTSFASHAITLHQEGCVGRYTDFVEVMMPVLTQEAWARWWAMLEPDGNQWGWGYDLVARSVCGFSNMGILDCEVVRHSRPVSSARPPVMAECERFMKKHGPQAVARQLSYQYLR